MAFEFDSDRMFQMCALYLAKGLRIVRLHGIWPDGRCTCGNPEHRIGGSGQSSCGKHPVGENWRESYARSEDDIQEWIDAGKPFNVGVLLGPDGGVIDNEDDSPEATAYREHLGTHLLDTPSWTSGKSTHQLTKWDDCLASYGGVKKPGGLEVRIGAGGASTQSVLPPSWHWTGVQYEWLPGKSIDDIDVAETPKSLLMAVVNDAGGPRRATLSGELGYGATPLIYREVHDGQGRNKALLTWTWQKIVNQLNPLGATQREVLAREILDDNKQYIIPPKSDKEVLSIVHRGLEHYRKRLEAGWKPSAADTEDSVVVREAEAIDAAGDDVAVPVSSLEGQGLKKRMVGKCESFEPGDWRIKMQHGDPDYIILCVPAWENTPCRGEVKMTLEDFREPRRVAGAVFAATKRVILDDDEQRWYRAWRGTSASKNNPEHIQGLMTKLMARKTSADDVYTEIETRRYAQLAFMFLQELRRPQPPEDGRTNPPAQSGRAVWVDGDHLWFRWAVIWEDVGKKTAVSRRDQDDLRGRLKTAMGGAKLPTARHAMGGNRATWVVFDRNWLRALEDVAVGGDEELPSIAGKRQGGVCDRGGEGVLAVADES